MIKLFLAGNTSAVGKFHLPYREYTSTLERIFRNQKRKIPKSPEISEVFPARKSIISDIPECRLRMGIIQKIFNSVGAMLPFVSMVLKGSRKRGSVKGFFKITDGGTNIDVVIIHVYSPMGNRCKRGWVGGVGRIHANV